MTHETIVYYLDAPKGILAKATLRDYIIEFFPGHHIDDLKGFEYVMHCTNHTNPRIYTSISECIYWESSNYQEENMSHADQIEGKTWGLAELEELHGITFF